MKELLPYYKNIFKLALPVIISQVGGMTVGLADTIMVGRLGDTQLAAVAFSNSLSWVIFMFGMGLAMGLTPLVGRAFARKDKERLGSLLKNSLYINAALGVVFTLVILGLSLAMGHMGQDPAILPDAKRYIFYQILSALLIMLFSTSKQFLEGIGNTTYAMMIMISGNVLNIFLNYLLIFGKWGFPDMGAAGAGASTFISRVYMVVMFLAIMWYKTDYRQYLILAYKSSISKFRMRRLLNIGVPIAGQLSIEMGGISLMAIAIGTFGATALAGHQVAINIPSLSFMVVTGLASATTIIVSQNYGLRLFGAIRKTLKAALHLVTAYMLFSAIFIMIFAVQISSVFTTDSAVIEIAAYLLLFGAAFQLSDGIQGIVVGALRGLMVVKKPMIYAITVYVCVAAPLGYLLAFVLEIGAGGVWIAFIVALTTLAALYTITYKKAMKKLENR